MDLNKAISERRLVKIEPSEDLAVKELKESLNELKRAKKASSDNDEKLVITSSYYSMFHAAKALLFKLGWLEKSHIAILVILEDLNKKGKLETRFLNYYRSAMNAREAADYNYTYSSAAAEECLSRAEEFSKEIRRLSGLNLNR
ncbi:MAG TPA: HEPN domain-containing protein [Nanoarchaeota archaeon]|nr:MAG: hypothetical protein QT01_C0002G0014 [archaeon GW2011_AR6]HIH17257.1 HEPN domain-containing protein [Nanoarchaeota archaeon]HIH34302.1 HEPN domain-containing protein [Nanoarchaeota archaeon]HIH50840.1 HEPN domain-containing protein [Nanoarchaeota archaeon]HIH65791.1 HEPN domain-containing protein [Nanoarchaeota archaeon]